MNPTMATWINAAITAAFAGWTAYEAAGGNGSAAIGAGITAAIAALNTALHAVSTSQAGPLGK